MDSPRKEDCKYWDKCYQRNKQHREKYNHPAPTSTPSEDEPQSTTQSSEPQSTTESSGPQSTTQSSDTQSTTKSSEPQSTTESSDLRSKTPSSEPQSTTRSLESEASKKRKTSDSSDDNESIPKKNNPGHMWQFSDDDYKQLLLSNKFMYSKFLVKMPKDFYQFWEFVQAVSTPTNPDPLKCFECDLIGPYDFICGRFANMKKKTPEEYLRHCRFYYDPPEFQTVFMKKGTGIHYGYWRDDPKDNSNMLIARNDVSKDCKFNFIATNMFDAFAYFLEKDFTHTPFKRAELSKIRKGLNEFVSVKRIDRDALIVAKNNRMKKVVAKTFHGVGIALPYSASGYRPLPESEANIKKILSILESADNKEKAKQDVLEELQPIVNAAVVAVDECDFGTSFELGINLFSSGFDELHSIVESLLSPAYKYLERPHLITILKAHLENRKKGFNVSMLT